MPYVLSLKKRGSLSGIPLGTKERATVLRTRTVLEDILGLVPSSECQASHKGF